MNALHQLSKAELIAIILRLEEQVARLEKRIAKFEKEVAKLRKNSSTSSKPPSSDIVKPPKPKGRKSKKQRKIGSQPGHPKHERKPFAEEDVTDAREHHLDYCPDCGGKMKRAKAEPRAAQQVEVVESPVRIDEHRSLAYYCPHCRKLHYAPLPPEVERGGLVGPCLTALVAYMKCACHASFSTIRKFLRDVMKITISRGQLAKLIRKVSRALKGVHEDLLERVLPSHG